MMTDPAASRPGTHLDPDQIADLVEGLMQPAMADAARAHLAACPLCSGDFALIAGENDDVGVAAWSEVLPPVPIPRDVAVRVEAALHREPPLTDAGSAAVSHAAPAAPAASASHASSRGSSRAARPWRRRFGLALGGVAGATLAVVVGIGVLSSTDSGTNGKSASGSALSKTAPSSSSGDSAHAGEESPNGKAPALGTQGTGSAGGSPGTAASIEKQAEELLGLRVESPASGTAQLAKPQCSPSPVAVGTRPLVSTLTDYQGRQAWLMIYAEPGNPAVADVYVVDVNSCTSGDSAQVVYQTTVARR